MIKYFSEVEHGCGVKIDFGIKKAWAKYPDKEEIVLSFDSKIVELAYMHGEEITENEYLKYDHYRAKKSRADKFIYKDGDFIIESDD